MRWRIRVATVAAGPGVSGDIVIRRGDPVVLVHTGNGFAVSTGGTTAENGRSGGVVRVKLPTVPEHFQNACKAREKSPSKTKVCCRASVDHLVTLSTFRQVGQRNVR